MANKSDSPSSNRPQNPDLLPNEREISYDAIHNFFARNKMWILTACFLFLLAAAGFSLWRMRLDDLRKKSEAELAKARDPEALESVARNYPETQAASFALIQLGGIYFDRQQWDKAAASYRAILDQYATNPFAPSAAIGLASILEAKGQTAEALSAYRKVASDYPSAFQCPQALFAAARLLENTGQWKDARQAYEDFVSRFPQSPWRDESSARLQRISLQLKKTETAPVVLPKVIVK